jgi:hypothetical protein
MGNTSVVVNVRVYGKMDCKIPIGFPLDKTSENIQNKNRYNIMMLFPLLFSFIRAKL